MRRLQEPGTVDHFWWYRLIGATFMREQMVDQLETMVPEYGPTRVRFLLDKPSGHTPDSTHPDKPSA